MDKMPKWADVALIPLISLLLALAVSGLVVLFIGENPVEAMRIMAKGAVGSAYGWGYTLYYATNFIFTGLAVAVAFQARLFNIGGEGQAAIGGLGVALVCLSIPWPHWTLALPCAVIGGAVFGAAWAAIPAYLQARRGSHIVITTIMFNYIASALMIYLLVNVIKKPGSMAPETSRFPEGSFLPSAYDLASLAGLPFPRSAPLNVSFLIALLCCVLVYVLIWRTRLGYQIRAFGHSEPAAVYAGISPVRITLITMLISGALAGMLGVNAVMGEARAPRCRSCPRRRIRWHSGGVDGPFASCRGAAGGAFVRHAVPRRRRARIRDSLRQPGNGPRDSGIGDTVHRSAGQHDPHACRAGFREDEAEGCVMEAIIARPPFRGTESSAWI